MNSIKSLFVSKTFILAVLQAIVGVIVIFSTSYPDIGWLVIAKSIVDTILRMYTSEPVSIAGRM